MGERCHRHRGEVAERPDAGALLWTENDTRVEFPTGGGELLHLVEVAAQLSGRLASIVLPDGEGRQEAVQNDPHWQAHLLIQESVHGGNDAGIGASHQTGCTGGVVASVMHDFASGDQDSVLERGPIA